MCTSKKFTLPVLKFLVRAQLARVHSEVKLARTVGVSNEVYSTLSLLCVEDFPSLKLEREL